MNDDVTISSGLLPPVRIEVVNDGPGSDVRVFRKFVGDIMNVMASLSGEPAPELTLGAVPTDAAARGLWKGNGAGAIAALDLLASLGLTYIEDMVTADDHETGTEGIGMMSVDDVVPTLAGTLAMMSEGMIFLLDLIGGGINGDQATA